MVWSINALYCPPVGFGSWGRLAHNAVPSPLQQQVLDHWWTLAARFVRSAGRIPGSINWSEQVHNASAYDGHSLRSAASLVASDVDFPLPGHGA
eukprot:12287986-Karenia_brevis.AAC.1